MFLLLSIILFMRGKGLCIMPRPVLLTGPMFLLGGSLSLVPYASCGSLYIGSLSRRVSVWDEVLCAGESLYRGSLSR